MLLIIGVFFDQVFTKHLTTILAISTGDALIVPLYKSSILQRPQTSVGFVSVFTGLTLKQLKTQNRYQGFCIKEINCLIQLWN